MARKDIFDRIDSKMRNQMATLGRTSKKDEETSDADYVEKRVNRRVIRRRARKPAPEPEVTPTVAETVAAEVPEPPEPTEPSLEAEPAAVAEQVEPTEAPEQTAPPVAEEPPVEDTPAPAAEEAEPAAEVAEDEAAPAAAEAEASEPVAEPEAVEETPEEPAPEGADEPQADTEITEPPPAEAAEAPEASGEEAEDLDAPEAPEAAEAAEPVEAAEAAVAEAAPAEESVPAAADPAEVSDQAEPAEAVEPIPAPVEASGEAPDMPTATDSMSLEDLLRKQGIVQHKPKKGRRIITEAPMPERRPIPKPVIRQDIRAQQMLKQAQQAGFKDSPGEVAGQPRDGGRRRAPGHDRLERDLRAERERERRMQRTTGKKKSRRKSIVQRPDMVYYPDRRSTRKKAAARGGPARKTTITQPKAQKRVIRIDNEISVGELAKELGLKAPELIRAFIGMGQMVTINDFVDAETAGLVAAEYEYTVENTAFKEEEIIVEEADAPEDLEPRPPVITVMGHVDHGKTSILDAIRNARVAAREAGGITQHIGAYQVDVGGQTLTFLDTPGHEAFTAMRARGAQCTDLVVLVVAANDGVMPQTIEAINHARAAGVPILVAINKIDLPNINISRVKTELSEQELAEADWGGDTVMVEVSATKGTGLEDLLEMIALQTEMLELKGNPTRASRGVVIEGKLSKGVGPVATVLVQAGTFEVGDYVVAGSAYGRVRAMLDYSGKRVKSATPAVPVEIHGLSAVPLAGDEVAGVEDEKGAKLLVEHRLEADRSRSLAKSAGATADTLAAMLAASAQKELAVVLKADVQGSVEAVRDALSKIEVDETRLNILHTAVGGITESDVILASASNGMILGFHVRPDGKAARLAEQQGVTIRTYRVIYEALEEIENMLLGLLEPIYEEEVQGRAKVRDIFKIPKIGVIAGCHVDDGTVARPHKVRLLRAGIVVWEGKLASLKRFKDDAKEVTHGFECGIGLDGYHDIKKGDVIETYTIKEVARKA